MSTSYVLIVDVIDDVMINDDVRFDEKSIFKIWH